MNEKPEIPEDLPGPKSTYAYRVHYLNGFMTDDVDEKYVRIYPDTLSSRLYWIVARNDVEELIEWSPSDLSRSSVYPVGSGRFFSVGIPHGATVQIVKVNNVVAGGRTMKAFIGLSPEELRLRQLSKGTGKYHDEHDDPEPDEGTIADPPQQVTSMF